MNRHIRGFIAAAAIGLGLSGAAQAQQFVNVLTGGTRGIYYPLSVAPSQL